MELEKPPGIQMIPVIALEWDIAIARLQSVIGNSRETKGGKAYQCGLQESSKEDCRTMGACKMSISESSVTYAICKASLDDIIQLSALTGECLAGNVKH